MVGRQSFGDLAESHPSSVGYESACALGAAGIARFDGQVFDHREWEYLGYSSNEAQPLTRPDEKVLTFGDDDECEESADEHSLERLSSVIVHLNDAHRVPLLEIANWIDRMGFQPK